MRKKGFLFLGKIAVSAMLLYLIFKRIDPAAIRASWAQVQGLWIALSLAFMFGRMIFSVLRWKMLLAYQGIHVPVGKLYHITLQGTFIGNFLPGSQTGADIYRAIRLGNDIRHKTHAATTLFQGRLHGLISFFAIGLVGGTYFWIRTGSTLYFLIDATFFLGGCLMIWGIYTRGQYLQNMLQGKSAVAGIANRFVRPFLQMGQSRDVLVKSLGLSLLFQMGSIAIYWCTGMALNIRLSILDYLFVVPASSIIAMAPVSLGGIGVREGTAVFLFSELGIPPGAALSLMMMILLQFLIMSCAGFLAYILSK